MVDFLSRLFGIKLFEQTDSSSNPSETELKPELSEDVKTVSPICSPIKKSLGNPSELFEYSMLNTNGTSSTVYSRNPLKSNKKKKKNNLKEVRRLQFIEENNKLKREMFGKSVNNNYVEDARYKSKPVENVISRKKAYDKSCLKNEIHSKLKTRQKGVLK